LEHYPQGIDQARFVEFGLNTSDSEAAKQLGVTQHSLNPQQIKEVGNIAGESFSKPPRFFERIFDYIATFVSAVIGLFTGGPSFGSFGKMRAERTAMRSAEKTHKMLVARGYESLADQISGIQPDGKGDYTPLLDKDGKRTGLLGREI